MYAKTCRSGVPLPGLWPLPPFPLLRLPLAFRFSAKLFGVKHHLSPQQSQLHGVLRSRSRPLASAQGKGGRRLPLDISGDHMRRCYYYNDANSYNDESEAHDDGSMSPYVASSEKTQAGPSMFRGGGERHH